MSSAAYCCSWPAAAGEDAGGGVTPSAVSNRICWSGRGRSPFHTRAAVTVSGWPAMPTRVMSPVPGGRGSRITPGGGPAMIAGPVSTAAGRLAVAAKASSTGRECRSGGSENGKPHIVKRMDRPGIRVIPEWFGGGSLPRKELHEAANELTANQAGLVAFGEPTIEEALDKALTGAAKVVKRNINATADEITSELQEALKG